MNTSKLFLLFDYLNETKRVAFVSRKLLKQFPNENTLELKLWLHIKRVNERKKKKDLKLDKTYILNHLFNNDSKSLNRTASRLFKRMKNILVEDFIQKKPLLEDWLFRETIKKIPNRLEQLILDNIIANKYETKVSFEKDLYSYIQFHSTYEKYLDDSLKNISNTLLFIKTRQSLENYYIKYHSILETERLQRGNIRTNENINALTAPKLNKKDSLLESELLLQKVNALQENPHYFDFCLNWLTHVVEEDLISREMQKTIYPILYNFSLRHYTENGQSLHQVYLNQLIYLALDKKVLFTGNSLSTYIYVAFLGSISVHPEKTAHYVDKYLKEVNAQEYDKADYISKLYIAFYNNQFEDVLVLIHKNEANVSLGSDPSLKSKIRFFLLRTYFELKDEYNFIKQSLIAKKYYKNQNLAPEKEAKHIHAIEILKKLFYIKNDVELLDLEKVVIQNNIAIKTWILKKIKESPFYPKE